MARTVNEMINDFRPQLERPGKLTVTWIVVTIMLVLAGIFALVVQILEGHIVTGMRDNVVWGIYIINFIFFMGISYAGALVSGTMHLMRTPWRGPIVRIAAVPDIDNVIGGARGENRSAVCTALSININRVTLAAYAAGHER